MLPELIKKRNLLIKWFSTNFLQFEFKTSPENYSKTKDIFSHEYYKLTIIKLGIGLPKIK